MRFPRPAIGSQRVLGKYLLLPKDVGGETRWLEHAWWLEEYRRTKGGEGWCPIRWVECNNTQDVA